MIGDIKNKPMPDKDNFIPKVKYSLPFDGAWVAVNGGIAKELSHAREINSQRYAYDLIMLDNEGKVIPAKLDSVGFIARDQRVENKHNN